MAYCENYCNILGYGCQRSAFFVIVVEIWGGFTLWCSRLQTVIRFVNGLLHCIVSNIFFSLIFFVNSRCSLNTLNILNIRHCLVTNMTLIIIHLLLTKELNRKCNLQKCNLH